MTWYAPSHVTNDLYAHVHTQLMFGLTRLHVVHFQETGSRWRNSRDKRNRGVSADARNQSPGSLQSSLHTPDPFRVFSIIDIGDTYSENRTNVFNSVRGLSAQAPIRCCRVTLWRSPVASSVTTSTRFSLHSMNCS